MNFKFDHCSNFTEYQFYARKTAIYPNKGNNYIYPTLGLCGESGEVSEKIKKIIRDNGGLITDESRNDIQKELGDVLWYISNLAFELGIDLQSIAKLNLVKIYNRLENDTINGDGDNR